MNLSEATRAHIYRVLLVAQPLATAYGIIDEQKAVLWLALVCVPLPRM